MYFVISQKNNKDTENMFYKGAIYFYIEKLILSNKINEFKELYFSSQNLLKKAY